MSYRELTLVSIAAGSTINGITVEIFKKTVSGVGAPADVDVTILKACSDRKQPRTHWYRQYMVERGRY